MITLVTSRSARIGVLATMVVAGMVGLLAQPVPATPGSTGQDAPEPPADLALTMTNDGFAAGETVTYTLVVTNNGPGSAPDWTLTNWVPSSLTDLAVSSDDADCVIDGEVVICEGGPLDVDGTSTVAVAGNVPEDFTGFAVNTATVSSSWPDPDRSNNTYEIIDTVVDESGFIVRNATAETECGASVEFDVPILQSGVADGSVFLVNPDGEHVTELEVEGEGTWSIPAAVMFDPIDEHVCEVTPVSYVAALDEGIPMTGVLAVQFEQRDPGTSPSAPDHEEMPRTGGGLVVPLALLSVLLILAGLSLRTAASLRPDHAPRHLS